MKVKAKLLGTGCPGCRTEKLQHRRPKSTLRANQPSNRKKLKQSGNLRKQSGNLKKGSRVRFHTRRRSMDGQVRMWSKVEESHKFDENSRQSTCHEKYKTISGKLSTKWRLMFKDDTTVLSTKLKKTLSKTFSVL